MSRYLGTCRKGQRADREGAYSGVRGVEGRASKGRAGDRDGICSVPGERNTLIARPERDLGCFGRRSPERRQGDQGYDFRLHGRISPNECVPVSCDHSGASAVPRENRQFLQTLASPARVCYGEV